MHGFWRFVSTLTAVLDRLLVLAVAGALAFDLGHALWGSPEDPGGERVTGVIDTATQWIRAHPTASFAAAIALVALNLNLIQFVLYSFVNRPSRAYIESQAPGGQSRVALRAVQNALAATAAQVPEIARSRIRVLKLGAHRYRVHIRYFVRDVTDAGNAAEHLRLVLKKRFSDLVVLDPRDRVEFDLDLAGIAGIGGRGRRTQPLRELPRPTEDRADAGFKGPIYPVEGGDGG